VLHSQHVTRLLVFMVCSIYSGEQPMPRDDKNFGQSNSPSAENVRKGTSVLVPGGFVQFLSWSFAHVNPSRKLSKSLRNTMKGVVQARVSRVHKTVA